MKILTKPNLLYYYNRNSFSVKVFFGISLDFLVSFRKKMHSGAIRAALTHLAVRYILVFKKISRGRDQEL